MDQKLGQFHGSFQIVASWSAIHTTLKKCSSTTSDCKNKNNSMHQTLCVVLFMHGHWMRMTLLCMFFTSCVRPILMCLCMSTRANAVRHLLYTRYSKFSKFQSQYIYSSWLKSFLFSTSTVFSMMLGIALEHEINVLEESYCINVLSSHFTLKNVPQM